jgi:hypothetical protein
MTYQRDKMIIASGRHVSSCTVMLCVASCHSVCHVNQLAGLIFKLAFSPENKGELERERKGAP